MRLFPNRTCPETRKWKLWRWHDIILDDELYLTRLNLIATPWFSVKLHWIHRPDPDRDLHDHPWPFVAFVLRGSYFEFESKDPRNKPGEVRWIKWFNYKNTKTGHRIAHTVGKVLTLVITGPKNRKKEWGFYDAETMEYKHWKEYEEAKA